MRLESEVSSNLGVIAKLSEMNLAEEEMSLLYGEFLSNLYDRIDRAADDQS